jgi:PHP family Zn ribbon phosphoesterase
MITTCPNCRTTFDTDKKQGKRICCLCGKPIKKHDKYHFNSESKIQHRHCDNPEGYVEPIQESPNLFTK